MTFESLKQSIHRNLETQQFIAFSDERINHVNRILTGVLVLNHLQKLISINSKYNTDTNAVIKEYLQTYKNIAESLKGKYISFKLIYNKILSYNLSSFININTRQVSEILQLYENKEQIKTFSPVYFSQHMYNVTHLNDAESNSLAFAHKYVISPIAEHYVSCMNVRYSDISADAITDGFIGKTIDLSISGVKNTRIIADIEKNIFGNKQYLYKYFITSEGFTRLIIK